MDIPYIVPILALLTMLALIIFAMKSKKDVEDRRDDPNATKSTLASDKASDGKPADV